MEIRDPVHGFIEVDEEIEPFLDLPLLQRLRRIRQTALANLLYPGANHTRFEHSLGCMHVAARLAAKLGLKDEEAKDVKVAALLHDVGHGPYSHVSEQLLAEYTSAALVEAEALHEQVTLALLEQDKASRRLLGDRLGRVSGLIKSPKMRSVEQDIVNGPFDADKLDYLLRDSHYCGVKYGVVDLERIVNTVAPIYDGPQGYMGIKEDGFWAIEQLLLAKHHMNLQVYRHRVRRITDAMLVRAVQVAIANGDEELMSLYSFSADEEFANRYLASDDEWLMRALLGNRSHKARDYAGRLIDRRLMKEVFFKYTADFKDARNRRNILSLSRTDLRGIERSVAEAMKPLGHDFDPDDIIVDIQSFSNPTFRPPGVEIREQDVMVLMADATCENATEVPNTLLGKAAKPKEEAVSVYLPLDGLSKEERDTVRRAAEAPIVQILESVR